MKPEPIVFSRLASTRTTWALSLSFFAFCGIAAAQSPATLDDTTSLKGGEQDPLRWTAGHEVQFTGRARSGGADLRSGPDPAYPVMKHLAGGEPLLAVDSRKEFIAVLVPDGFHAYVKREYVALNEDGTGVIKGASVNLRSRPSTENDYPICSLPSSTTLWVIGPADKDDAWLEVVAPDVPIWISDSDLDLGGDLTDPAFRAEVTRARERRHADWTAHSVGAKEAAAKRSQERQLAGKLKGIEAALKQERDKGADANFAAIRADLASVLEEAGSGETRDTAAGLLADVESDERRAAQTREIARESERLKNELAAEKQRLQEAQRRSVEEAKNQVGPRVAVGDMAQISGFLRKRGDGKGASYALEKGAITSAYVRCESGRYRLDDFVGWQIEIQGRYVEGGPTPVIEASRLTILRH